MINKRGKIEKIITPPKTIKNVLHDANEAFREVFGRKQRQGDLILLGSLRHSPKEFDRLFREACKEAGTPGYLVYATEKTGLVVADQNYDRLSPRDLRDWNEAIDEYHKAESDGIDLLDPPLSPIQVATLVAKKVVDDATIHLGSYLNRRPIGTNKDKRLFFSI